MSYWQDQFKIAVTVLKDELVLKIPAWNAPTESTSSIH
jgi:hypothetical protein